MLKFELYAVVVHVPDRCDQTRHAVTPTGVTNGVLVHLAGDHQIALVGLAAIKDIRKRISQRADNPHTKISNTITVDIAQTRHD